MTITLQANDFTINALGGVLDSRNPSGTPPNQAPVWATIPTQTAQAGSTVAISSYASDPNGDALTFQRVGGTAPAGVTVNASTGLITVPAGTAAGTYTVIVRASDGSLTTDQTVTVTVNNTATFTITGSGFGTRASLTPLFYRFFSPGEITNGVAASSYGYTVGGTVTANTSDGYVSGSGCLWHESTLGAFDSFPHLHYVLASDKAAIFQTYVYKLTRIAGATNSGPFQMKGPRVSYGSEYTGVPRSTISFYHPSDCSAVAYTNLGFYNAANAGSGGSGADDFGASPAYASRFRANGWNLVEDFTNFGSVGASDGYQRVYHNGSQVGPYAGVSENIPFRSLSAHAIQYVSLFPGIDSFSTSNRYRVQFAEHVVDDTQARVVIGNASTWGACTQRQYMIPTAWSDTSVTASWRALGFATSGQTVYGYVVNASGTVSAATSLVVP